jgi:RNA polymerase sigma factor (sigma-70 family)
MLFDEVYGKYYNELRRFGHQLNLSSERSEDIIQETYLKFFLELKKGMNIKNPRAWLYKVFLNHFKNQVKKQNLINISKLNPEHEEKLSGDINTNYVENERQQIIIKMMNQLEARDKDILLLYHKGFSYAEMADIMGMNPNSTGKTLVRAIENLKKTLKTNYHEMFEPN